MNFNIINFLLLSWIPAATTFWGYFLVTEPFPITELSEFEHLSK
jgi:hypothetical protein